MGIHQSSAEFFGVVPQGAIKAMPLLLYQRLVRHWHSASTIYLVNGQSNTIFGTTEGLPITSLTMQEVDLNQDPADFAALAKNPEPADPNGQPTVPEPGGSTPPEVTPPVTPEAPAKAEDTPKPAVEPEVKPPVAEVPADPQGQPKVLTPEEKQAQEAARKITELGEENAQKFKSMVAVVRENPDSLKSIHTTDPRLADQIAKELWGADDFQDLMKQAEIEELKANDPDAAKSAQELYELRKENQKTQNMLKQTAESSFFASKGIVNNPFDPKYKTLQEALENVNPQIVKDDYQKALALAHQIAFPARTDAEIEADKKAIMLAKGTGVHVAPGIAPSNQREPDSQLSPEQQGFLNAVKG